MTGNINEQQTITLEKGLTLFLDSLLGKNRSKATIRAYSADVSQLVSFLHASNVTITYPSDVAKVDILEYLSFLAKKRIDWCCQSKKIISHQGIL